ncbi:MAG: hypothetical protein C0592_12360 [Marinilabiliales bacterium]|nr:MAG: hypothetical protein C0592_12360 [Marinilabiliales bacterium]
MKKLLVWLIPVLFLSLQTTAQLNTWSKRVYIEISEEQGTMMNDFPVRMVINTQTPIGTGDMDSNGDDIRFTSDSCGYNLLPYWIESGINTDSTVIFVKADFVGANASDSIFMFYGSAGAAPMSNIDSVFSSYWISGGVDTTLYGIQMIQYFQLDAGDTLTLQADTALLLNAYYTNINGFVYGKGKGYPASTVSGTYANGEGPGAGAFNTSEASSGGGYGGQGGEGGDDTPPGVAGGVAYGTNNTDTIQMGSSGGSADNGLGGNGGGSFSIRGIYSSISGIISVEGDTSAALDGSRGGGGGAGGGFLVNADVIVFSGSVNADGGIGGYGGSSANDGGGGGAGGRIKMFYNDTLFDSGSTSVLGGQGGGISSSSAPGSNGADGTVYTGITGGNVKYNLVVNAAIDNPGCSSVSLNEYEQNTWAIYPNPTRNDITIELLSNTNNSTIEIFDFSGRMIISETLYTTSVYSLGEYGSGIYLIKISDNTHVENFKVIVE